MENSNQPKAELRQEAEEIVKKNVAQSAERIETLSPGEMQSLLHE